MCNESLILILISSTDSISLQINYFRKDDESDESLDLARFGQLGRAMLRPVPGHYSLMGHLSVEANDLPKITQRKPRQARPKDAIAELKAPIKV